MCVCMCMCMCMRMCAWSCVICGDILARCNLSIFLPAREIVRSARVLTTFMRRYCRFMELKAKHPKQFLGMLVRCSAQMRHENREWLVHNHNPSFFLFSSRFFLSCLFFFSFLLLLFSLLISFSLFYFLFSIWISLNLSACTHTVPTQDIELVWQSHLIRPHLYRADCERLWGRVIEHKMGMNLAEEIHFLDALKRTEELWLEAFGESYSISQERPDYLSLAQFHQVSMRTEPHTTHICTRICTHNTQWRSSGWRRLASPTLSRRSSLLTGIARSIRKVSYSLEPLTSHSTPHTACSLYTMHLFG